MSGQPMLRVRDLTVQFHSRGWRFIAPNAVVKAVDGVSFDIDEGEVLGLVGESGSGKSTIARTLMRLQAASSGSVEFRGLDILVGGRKAFGRVRRDMQMIFQDPAASLNPRLTILQTLGEPARIHGISNSRRSVREKVAETLERVGLDPQAMMKYPHEFSGGQKQRIGIARAMILKPKLVIADEAVSALDVSIQAQILNLLKSIQRESGVSMLFISHDLGIVRHISNRVAVMRRGGIVEMGDKKQVFGAPRHEYTRRLLDAAPRIPRFGNTR